MSRPIGMSIKQTVIALPAATSTVLVAQNANRKYLAVTNIGVNPASLAFDTTAVASQGYPLVAADAVGDQGGGLIWEAGVVPINGVNAISTLGTSIVVLEGV